MRRDVGDEERYCEGDTVPFIKAEALRDVLVFNGEDSEEKKVLAGLIASEANERTEERPGTVLIVDDVPLEPVMAVLYGRGELNIVSEDLGEAGGVMPRSRRGLDPPDVVIGEVLADNVVSPLVDNKSGMFLPGEARRLGAIWTGYWTC